MTVSYVIYHIEARQSYFKDSGLHNIFPLKTEFKRNGYYYSSFLLQEFFSD